MDNNYDHALALSLSIIEVFESDPGAPKYRLLSRLVFLILHSMNEADGESHAAEPSAN